MTDPLVLSIYMIGGLYLYLGFCGLLVNQEQRATYYVSLYLASLMALPAMVWFFSKAFI